MPSKTAELLKSISPQLQVVEKGNVVEAILRQGKKILRLVAENKIVGDNALDIYAFSITIVNPPIVLSASFNWGVKKLFAKKADEMYSYVVMPKKQMPFLPDLSLVKQFLNGDTFTWIVGNFKMSGEVMRWWESELLQF